MPPEIPNNSSGRWARRPLPRLNPQVYQQQNRPQRNLPLPPKPRQKRWTSDAREIMALISIYGHKRLCVILRYQKVPDSGAPEAGQVVTRMVEPYSVRVKIGRKRGQARYFYGYDVEGPTIGIHSFLISNIQTVIGTDRRYQARWEVEFG